MEPIGITMGDANGVGPEILLRAWADGDLPGDAVVYGDRAVLERCAETMDLILPPQVVDLGLLAAAEVRVGEVSAETGAAGLAYVRQATEDALAGTISAIATLPMNKEATRLTAPDFSGHTGFIAGVCGVTDYTMMLACDRLIVTHVSTHVALREAVDAVTSARVARVISLTADALRRLGRVGPIAVLGLNPHAGEGGAFGREEIDWIAPAVATAQADGIDVVGPLPPDTVFAAALEGRYAAVVCMYHDQGHIPMKLIAFDEAVNVTLGLPIVRTSVDHGTAFDIAWQGVASTRSFVNACRMAKRLADAP